jgi:hypothetical protein
MKYNASLLDLALNNVEALSKEISFFANGAQNM